MTAPDPPGLPPIRSRTGGAVGTALTLLSAAALALVWGTAAAARQGTAMPSLLVAGLAVLPYVAGLLVAWLFLLWTVLPDRRDLPVLLVVATVLPLAWWGPGWRARPAPDEGASVRVMSWNVRRLWGAPEDERDATACVSGAIAHAAPDVLLLQEVTRADVDALEATLALDCAWGTYQAADHEGGSGIAACARAPWRREGGGPEAYAADADWRYVATDVTHDGDRLRVIGVHFQPWQVLDAPVRRLPDAALRLPRVTARQQAQAEALAARLEALDVPAVVGGDFNATPDTPMHSRLRRHLVDAWDVGAAGMTGTVRVLGWLPLRIDYVYVTPGVGVRDTRVVETACSDHRPVIADLRLPPAEAARRAGPAAP